MRSGRLLAEREPQYLCDFYHCCNLEEVFLKLCHHQEQRAAINDNTAANGFQNGEETEGCKQIFLNNGATNNSNNNLAEQTPLLNSETYRKSGGSQKNVGVGFGLLLWRLFTPGLPNPWNILALFVKNFLKFMRNFGLLIFQFCIPSIQVISYTCAPIYVTCLIIYNMLSSTDSSLLFCYWESSIRPPSFDLQPGRVTDTLPTVPGPVG